METLISTVLSVFGLGQRSLSKNSDRRVEANRLNNEFEILLHKASELLRTEELHLKHRCSAFADEGPELFQSVQSILESLQSEIKVGLDTVKNSRASIAAGSSFTSLNRWDESISLLQQQRSAAELQIQRCEQAVQQFHRILDDA